MYSSKLISISPATVLLPDFRNFFFDLLESPLKPDTYWETLIAEYRLSELGCAQDGTSTCDPRNQVPMYDYVPAALDAVYSLAVLLSRAHAKHCGRDFVGVCEDLASLVWKGLLMGDKPAQFNYSDAFAQDKVPEAFRQGRTLVWVNDNDFMAANSPQYFINSARNGNWVKVNISLLHVFCWSPDS